MWSRLRRRLRRRSSTQLDLAEVDRLGELVERIVALLPDAAAEAAGDPHAPADVHEPRPEAAATLLFVAGPSGYRLAEADPVGRGARVVLADGAFRVLRLGPSPLPGDARRCAFLEREEPSAAERTSDA